MREEMTSIIREEVTMDLQTVRVPPLISLHPLCNIYILIFTSIMLTLACPSVFVYHAYSLHSSSPGPIPYHAHNLYIIKYTSRCVQIYMILLLYSVDTSYTYTTSIYVIHIQYRGQLQSTAADHESLSWPL